MSAADKIMRQLLEQQADDRAHRLATIAAEEFIRCNGLPTNNADDLRCAQWIIAHGSAKRGEGDE